MRIQQPRLWMLQILQINLHHSKLACSNLVSILSKNDLSIVLIQEPWIKNSSIVCGLKVPGYTLCHSKGGSKVRACILIKNNIHFLFSEELSDGDTAVVALKKDGESILIASSYFPGDVPEIPSQLIRNIIERGRKFVMGCDSNAHNEIWGSTNTNDRGECLLDFIIEKEITICNRGREPTYSFANGSREEVLDITLCSNSLGDSVRDWKVWNVDSFSDHNYIRFNLKLEADMRPPRRNPKRTDWLAFKREVRQRLEPQNSHRIANIEELDLRVEKVTSILLSSYEKACPLPKKPRKQNPPWWSRDIGESVRDVRRLKSRLKKLDKHSQDFLSLNDEYREGKKKLGYMIRKAKRESWRAYCESIDGSDEASRLRKILAKECNPPGFLKRSDGTWAESNEEIANILMDAHFPESERATDESITGVSSVTTSANTIRKIVTKKGIGWAVRTFKPYKSAGPDGVFPAMIQHSLDELMPCLMEIFKTSLQFGYVPKLWREVKVVFIQKAGRACHSVAKDYRPISLSSFLLKTLERLVEHFIRSRLTPNQISRAQHAYCKGKSTETALHTIVRCIEDSISNHEYTLAAFIDIEGAFNNVTATSIIEALKAKDVENGICLWVNHMLTSRIVTAEIAGTSVTRTVNRGTPQGGVISPLLWLLVVDEILRKLEDAGATVIGYADDLAILVRGKFPDVLSELIERNLLLVKRWACSRGLGVNAEKTELVLFTRRYKIPCFKLPKLDGKEIKLSDEAKYLGIILDKKLNWKSNVEARRKKALIAWYTCNKCLGKKWGLKPYIAKWIYTAVVRPVLCYGALVWWNTTKLSSRRHRLTSVQRQACLGISGVMRSTPQAALEVMLDIIPLDLFLKGLACKAATRLMCLGLFQAGSKRGHRGIVKDMPPGTDWGSDFDVKEVNLDCQIDTLIPEREQWSLNQVVRNGELEVYTDGSKTSLGTGAGVFCAELQLEKSIKLDDSCTVFQAEIMALKIAAENLLQKDTKGREISLYVDSQAAISAIGSCIVSSKLVKACREKVEKLSQENSVRICWVPGHSDFEGNEEADRLAKLGSDDLTIAISRDARPPLSYKKRKIEEQLLKEWSDTWTAANGCVISKLFWPKVDKKKTKECLRKSKRVTRTLFSLFTGHCMLGKHAKVMGLSDSDECRFCQDLAAREDIVHILHECPALETQRFRRLGTPVVELEDFHILNIKDLKNFISNNSSMSEIFIF